MNASEIIEKIKNVDIQEAEKIIFSELDKGNVTVRDIQNELIKANTKAGKDICPGLRRNPSIFAIWQTKQSKQHLPLK